MTEPDTTQAELDLQAVRYISGEMTPSEVEAFEGLLATSQSARDSVEQAVLLGTAVVHVTRRVPSAGARMPGGGASRRRWTFVAAVAAMWIAVIGVWWLRNQTEPTDFQPETAGAEVAAESGGQPDLLASWVDLETLNQAGLGESEAPTDSMDDLGSVDADGPAPGDELAAVETPAWMLEALAK